MSTLTRTNSHSKKPHYKDYVSFLDSYRNGKKDDQNSVVTSDSGVGFSLNSSVNNSSSSVFSDISDGSKENLNDKKFNTSLPPKHIVKTEVFIEIKNPSNYPTQIFEVQQPQESTISVSSAAKIFEKKDQTLKPKNSFKKNTIGEISKKFEASSHTTVDAGKPPVKRAASIGEVSKIFENGNNSNTLRKTKNFNAVPKPFQPAQAAQVPKLNIEVKTNIKPAILSPKPVITVPALPKFIPDPPRSYADSVDSALSSLSISPSPPQCVSPPPGAPMSPPPPPPPLPPANFSSKPPPSSQKPLYNGVSSPPKVPNSQPITVQTNSVPQENGTLDRNDPRVKKAVYGALRNMYGAYHDQANDYLATLPKNRVRKNNGLDSIIDSIASQGGLDKLSGRSNPKQEAE